MALARRLLRLRPHLGALPLPSPSPPRLLPSRAYISDLCRSAFIDRLLRSEISLLDDSTPPPLPPPPAPFAVEDRQGEQWACLRARVPCGRGGGRGGHGGRHIGRRRAAAHSLGRGHGRPAQVAHHHCQRVRPPPGLHSSPRGEAVLNPATAPCLVPLLRLTSPSSRPWPGCTTRPQGPLPYRPPCAKGCRIWLRPWELEAAELVVASGAGERGPAERKMKGREGAVGLQRRERFPGMHNGGGDTTNCSRQCSICWSKQSST
jgi:hypothetical protein